MYSGEYLYERGFAGAVVADDSDNFAFGDVQLDVHERGDGAEGLVYAAQ